MASEFLEDLFQPEIKDQIVACCWPDGRRMCMSLRLFRMQNARNAKAIAEYDAAIATVVPFKKKRRPH